MTMIEEARAARPASTLHIPAGAIREIGNDAIPCAVEERDVAAEQNAKNSIRQLLSYAFTALAGVSAPTGQPREASK